MAERVQLKVDLEANLGKVVEATKSLKLDKGQTERLEKYRKGAELAYANGDLKTFQKNFNNVVKLFKEAASVTGKVSDEIKKLTDRQSALNQEINRLKDKKTSLEGKLTKDRSRITIKAARDFASSSADAKKVLTGSGKVATRDEIIELQKALADFLAKTGKAISRITNEDLKDIKTSSGLTFGSRNAMFAANRYVKTEGEYEASVKTDLVNTEEQIQTETNNYTELSNELKRMSQAAKDGAEDISKLYAEISKLGDDTNKEITDAVNEEKINKTDRTGATQGVSDLKTLEKQTNGLGKAFKQFTLYSVAIRGLKTALNEAKQTIKELDKYLTEQAMDTGLTREQTYGLVKSYQELALQCGATTKEIAEVSTEYMKQGKSIQESLTLTQAAVSAAKVARVSVGDSVNYLTTALNGFQLSAEDAMAVSDKFAAVAASSATDYDELAIALSKVASQANLAGMSIDYTTALLTKGLETTREAPETMGTALKTIIARMRELSDYGETLEGDTDINNVESQLAYVGIALKDANGELRSTEDVLDELGKKWDSLNKNQQAALAKALAGTRQQSRLIALMDDYERVTELQEISQRSAGATAAQAGVYLEGIEASMNKIQVAWEKIIMTVSDSEVIIGAFDWIGTVLDNLGDFLSNDFALGSTLALVASIGLTILGNKIKEWELNKLNNQLAIEQNKSENQRNILEQQAIIKQKKQAVLDIEAKIRAKQDLITAKKKGIELAKQLKMKAESNGNTAAAARYEKYILDAEKTIGETELEVSNIKKDELATAEKELSLEETKLDAYNKQTDIIKAQESAWGSMITGAKGLIAPLIMIWNFYKKIATSINTVIARKKAEELQTKKNTAANTKEAGTSMAGSAGKIPYVGWIIAAAILVTMGIAAGAAIMALSGAFDNNKSADSAAKSINNLSNEIYKLNEKANAINDITGNFDKLDNKLIKTNKDLKEMSSLLDQAADKLDDSVEEDEDVGYGKGVSEKDYYNSLQSDKAKREFLDEVEREARNKANAKRTEQINKLKGLSATELANFLDENNKSAEVLQAQDKIYALNNNELYEYIDSMKESKEITDEAAAATEKLTQSILEEMSVEEAWDYAKDNDGEKVRDLVDSLKDLEIQARNTNKELVNVSISEVLTSDDYELKDKVKAYEDAQKALSALGDTAALEAFNDAFIQYDKFSDYEDYVLDFIDEVGLSIDEVSELYESWKKLQKAGVKITQEQFEERFDTYLTALADTQGDVLTATQMVFGQFLDDSEDALNAFISAYGDLVQVGILNMGQNMDKVQNSINNFYEKSLKWNEMSESDKAEFIQDNAELFNENNGKELLKAFESGNYAAIEEALKNNDALQKQLDQRRREVAQELLIEEARDGDDRNEAYIAQLKEYEKYLNNTEELFKASLEIRLEQEEKQLEEFKKLKEEEQKAQVDALEKRKEAYEKYFEAINQEEEDEEYEEQANLLVSNLSKLGSSTNASAVQQTKELEKQLEELEEERLKELRERAQEAVLENMDKEVEEINEKFDELLENNRALLAAMQGELDNPSEYLAKLLSGQIEQGLSANELQQYIGTLQSTYGGVVGGDIEDISVREENNQLFLTVNGKDIVLDTKNEENLFTAIMKALREVGVR